MPVYTVVIRWHNMKDHSDQICMQVSPGAADLLTTLGEHLIIMEDWISSPLFLTVLEKVIECLDQLILTEVSTCIWCFQV